MKLMTFGYEGLQSRNFFELLKVNKVEKIVDLRELPLSRKPGFSKSALESSAEKHGLSYVHIPALGCPRKIRQDYRADDNWTRYTQRFMTYLKTQDAAIVELAELVKREQCCLLCYEADPNYCHRSFVAERVAGWIGSPLVVAHIKSPILMQAAKR